MVWNESENMVSGVNMYDFFHRETLPYPLWLSPGGCLETGEKRRHPNSFKGLVMTTADREPIHDMPKVKTVITDGRKLSIR